MKSRRNLFPSIVEARRNLNRIQNPKVPEYAPNDLSFYANIPVPTSYMCMGSTEDFFGGYDYFARAGIVHYADTIIFRRARNSGRGEIMNLVIRGTGT